MEHVEVTGRRPAREEQDHDDDQESPLDESHRFYLLGSRVRICAISASTSCGLKTAPNAGMAPPLPFAMVCRRSSSVRAMWNTSSRRFRGAGRPAAAGAPPLPSVPWQRAHVAAKRRPPSATLAAETSLPQAAPPKSRAMRRIARVIIRVTHL